MIYNHPYFLHEGGEMTHAKTVCARHREARMSSAAYEGNSLATLAGRATAGTITTVAGNGINGSSGDGGPATSASLSAPLGVALDSSGNLFIADSYNNRIRKVDVVTGLITTVAGSGCCGFSGDGGPATNAKLWGPGGVALDLTGRLFIADTSNHRIRSVDFSHWPPVANERDRVT